MAATTTVVVVSMCALLCALTSLPTSDAMRLTQERITTVDDENLNKQVMAELVQFLAQDGGILSALGANDVTTDDVTSGSLAEDEGFMSSPLLTECNQGKCKICKKGEFLSVCVEAAILKLGFSVAVSVNGKTVYHHDVTVASPPPLCMDKIPGLDKVSKLCVVLSKVDLQTKSACAKVTFNVKVGPVSKKITLDLGCFKIPAASEVDEEIEDSQPEVTSEETSAPAGDVIMTSEEIVSVIEELLLGLQNETELDMDAALTGCSHGKCEFCTHGKFMKACVVASYLRKEVGFQVTVTVNGKTIYNKEISVANPPPFCVDKIPVLKNIANLCIQVYDVNLKAKSACVKITFFVKVGVIKKKISLKVGCVHIPTATNDDDHVMETVARDTVLTFEPSNISE